jgi:hypothetical protein
MNKIKNLIKKHPALAIVFGFQLFRIALLPFMGLMPQDAYYHFYGENLSLSYFDHPGMIGYILRGFTDVFGQTVFVVKLADFIVTSFTLISFYKLSTYFLSKSRALTALVLISSTIFISILSFNSTPDVPLLLFWTLSLISLYKAIFQHNKWHWVLAGILMGLAFDSKYTSLFLQIGILGFLAFSNTYRKLLLSPWLWICLLLSFAASFPVWWWNYQHDFASFAFQGSNRTGSISKFEISPNFFFGAIAHQLLLLLPILFISFIAFTYKYIKRALFKFKLPSSKTLFLLAFFVPTFVGFFVITPVYWVKLNWMMPSYITGIIIAAMFMKKKWVKVQLYFSIFFHVLIGLQVVFYLAPIKSDDTWVGWKELSVEAETLLENHPNSFVFAADDYKTTAALNFFLEEKVYAQNIIGLNALHFDYVDTNLAMLNGKNAIFLDSDTRFKNKDKKNAFNHPRIQDYFDTVTELDPIIISINGKETRKFWAYYCTNYQSKK